MNREEILSASRKENNHRDLPELEAAYRAGAIAMRVGATVCAILAVLGSALADKLIYSPWIIYFSILGTHWLIRFTYLKKTSNFVVSVVLYALAILGTVFFVLRLLGGTV